MATKEDDYTKYRTVGLVDYNIEDKLGRRDPTYIYPVTVSGTELPGALLASH